MLVYGNCFPCKQNNTYFYVTMSLINIMFWERSTVTDLKQLNTGK